MHGESNQLSESLVIKNVRMMLTEKRDSILWLMLYNCVECSHFHESYWQIIHSLKQIQ